MPIGVCRVLRIEVLDDGDDWGSADMQFWLTINDSTTFLGRFPGVEDPKTIQLNRDVSFRLATLLNITFRAVDEEPEFWGTTDQIAQHTFTLNTSVFPLPRNGASVKAADDGVAARLVFDLFAQNALTDRFGDNRRMKCLGRIPGPRWLDGNTVEGSVALVENLAGHSGTGWRVHDMGNDSVAFECQGHLAGPRWLDGNTVNGTVRLAPVTGAPFTGTRWRAHVPDMGDGVYLECLGNVEGPRWLDGNTTNGAVTLAPQMGESFSGTLWRI
ncbi:hypothetical protein [Paracoccus pacificus]|uniref:Uncharacterized protein n=1 Tax=Paracoccus pacificus TaxID=1463598 RepID=A0ABW4RB15_9RHOB